MKNPLPLRCTTVLPAWNQSAVSNRYLRRRYNGDDDENNDFTEILEKWYDSDISNVLISDYGLEPLLKLAYEALATTVPEEHVLILNRMLMVWHQRSDLSELFVKGGSDMLDLINEDVDVNRDIMV